MSRTDPFPNLLTSLVGRKQEITDVRQLLTAARLVTLVGAGGCGKTRLAQAVASTVAAQFDGEVGWVELAHINDPAFVPQTVAKALQINEQPALSWLEMLQETLATRRLLLVLDNCEHLLVASAGVVEALLRTTPIQVLATSREPLGVPGERHYPVPPLTLPAVGQTLAQITHADAIQLFLERARHLLPDFALTPANAETVAAICRQLDGMPLAIELACARINVLSVEQIQQRLAQPLDLLVANRRTAQRHRTLRATIDWSYDLLSPHERMLLQRLTVFAAGFTLTTVEAACAWGELERSQILELLTSLVNKSLVAVETIQTREARYRVLETIRQYAGEKLAVSGERAVTCDHYLDSFLGVAEEIAPKLYEHNQKHWMQWLENEHDNLRVAFGWALESKSIEAGLRIAIALSRFWEVRSYVQEGLTWFERLLRHTDESVRLAVRVNALTFSAFLAHFLGLGSTTLAYGREAVRLAEAAGEEAQPLLVMALSGLSSGYEVLGDLHAAFATHERSLQLLRAKQSTQSTTDAPASWSPADAVMLGMTVMVQGDAAVEIDDFATARRYLNESLALATDDPFRMAMTFLFLGNLAFCEQDYPLAKTQYEQSVTLLRQLDATRDLTAPLQNLGYSCLHLGEVGRAHTLFGETLAIHQAQQNRLGIVECLLGFAAVAIVQGLPAAGVRLFTAAERIGWRRAKSSWAVTRRVIGHYLALARTSLSEAEFLAEQAAGQSLSLTQAIGFAQYLPLDATDVPPTQEKLDDLTEREREVAVLIGLGKSNGEVAEQLVLSKRTVEKHIANIFTKLSMDNRAQIVRWVIDQGLIRPGT
jgi:non-specific serine/threonine protein kinase